MVRRCVARRVGLVLVSGLVLALGATGAEARSGYGRGVAVGRASDVAESDYWRQRWEEGGWWGISPSPYTPPPWPVALYPGAMVTPWWPPTKLGPVTLEDLNLVNDGHGGYRGSRPAYGFTITAGGDMRFNGHWTLDLGDALGRAWGHGSYVLDKHLVLRLTQPMRDRMREAERRRRMQLALAELPGRLAALSSHSDLSPAARRQLLRDLWDELAEGDTPEGRGADEARRVMRPFLAAAESAAPP